jgi:hypothetical protein
MAGAVLTIAGTTIDVLTIDGLTTIAAPRPEAPSRR